MSRAIEKEEARQMFLDQVRCVSNYWVNLAAAPSAKEKVEGAIFSLMSILDGCSGGFPASVDLVLRPHPDDKQYCTENGENWIVGGQVINDDVHLHEIVFNPQRG